MPRINKSVRIWRTISTTEENPVTHGYLPINLTLEELKSIFDRFYTGKKKYNLERALSCLSTIIIHRYNVPTEKRKGAWYMGYTNVPATSFIKWVGSDYTDYLKTFLAANVLETDNCYVVKEKAKGYKFHPYYISAESSDTPNEWRKTYKVPYTDLNLLIKGYEARKLRKQNAAVNSGRTRLNAMGAELSKCVDVARVEADFNALSKQHGRNHCIGNYTLDECYFMLDRILAGEGSVYNEKDEFGFRFHTPFTNLPTLLRKYIIINGKEATEVDFKNSNAFYFGNIAKHPVAILSLMGVDVDKAAVKTISDYYASGVADFVTFVDKALEGKLYKFLSETVKLHGKSISISTAKKLVMKFMNSDSTQYVQLKAEVAKVLPTVVHVCNILNTNGSKTIPKLLQRTEASIIIDKIAVPLTTETQHPFSTVHDSFLCSEGDATLIVEKIRTVHAELGLAAPVVSYKGSEPTEAPTTKPERTKIGELTVAECVQQPANFLVITDNGRSEELKDMLLAMVESGNALQYRYGVIIFRKHAEAAAKRLDAFSAYYKVEELKYLHENALERMKAREMADEAIRKKYGIKKKIFQTSV